MSDLSPHLASDLDLTLVVLLAVRVTQVDHHTLCETRCRKFLTCGFDTGGVVVWLLTAAQDDVAIFVSDRGNDCRVTFLRHRQEVMRMLRSSYRVHRDTKITVRAILKAHRARQA